MSWFSKLSGSDAKKRNLRKLGAAARAAQEAAQRGENPADIWMPATQDWARTNNRVNLQTGLKAGGAMIGASLLGGGAGGGSGVRALGSSGAPGTAPAVPAAGFSWGGAARNVGQWALDNPELIAGALSTAGGLDAQRKAGRNEKKMLELIEREYAERAPLRALGLRNLTREMDPLDLSVFVNQQNPFSR